MPSSPDGSPVVPTLGAALRRVVLAAVVLDGLEAVPADAGVDVAVAAGDPCVPWADVVRAVRGAGSTSGADIANAGGAEAARQRVRDWLLVHRALQEDAAIGADVRELLVPLALPRAGAAHLGASWECRPVLGGAMDLGLGVALPSSTGTPRVVPLPRPVGRRVGVDGALSPSDLQRLERMGELAATRLRRDTGGRGGDVLRPFGGCDVPTLLASRSLREHLAEGSCGMRAVAVPARDRGWFDLRRVDPAFVAAAWRATPPERRGFPRALLVTREEVAVPAARLDLTRQEPALPER